MENVKAKASLTVNLHNLIITFETPNTPLLERFEAVYGHLPRLNAGANVLIRWDITPAPTAPHPPAHTPVIADDTLVSYYGSDNIIYIRMPKYGLLTVDLARRRLTGIVTRNCLEVYGAFEDVLMISLAPLYRRRGWFPLHAFAAAPPTGKAALITGQMGAGKTTTGLALLSAGWKLLSNDSPLLAVQEDKVQVLAYPGRLSAFDDSLAWFEPLRRFTKAEAEDREKRVFRVEEAFGNVWALAGEAGGLFFPQVVPGLTQSNLVAVAPKEALLQLMPQAIEGWDKATIAQNLQVIRRLVEQVPCYTVRLSPPLEQLHTLKAAGV